MSPNAAPLLMLQSEGKGKRAPEATRIDPL